MCARMDETEESVVLVSKGVDRIMERCIPIKISKPDCEKCGQAESLTVCRECIFDYIEMMQRIEEIRRL